MAVPLIAYTLPSTAVLMEEIYQNLSRPDAEPMQVIRRASGPVYQQACARLSQAGNLAQTHLDRKIYTVLKVTKDTYAGFLAGEDTHYQTVRDAIVAYLGHKGSVLHDKADNSRHLAVKWLVEKMTRALLEQHRQEHPGHPLTYATWNRFRQGSHAPTRVTMEAIGVFLGLEDEDLLTLYRLTRKEYLYGLERVCTQVDKQWEKWKKRMERSHGTSRNWDSLEVFKDLAGVSRKAMRGFGCGLDPDKGRREKAAPDTEPELAEKTTQGTMLKLAVAFRFDPAEAEGFLALLDSGFYDLRDLLFCSCLYLKVFDPNQVHEILEFYARNPADPSRPRLDDPYREIFETTRQDKK